ncbi:MAG: hypothetical protein ACO1RX_10550 [Candidatus Sericytochromatia bacterium]
MNISRKPDNSPVQGSGPVKPPNNSTPPSTSPTPPQAPHGHDHNPVDGKPPVSPPSAPSAPNAAPVAQGKLAKDLDRVLNDDIPEDAMQIQNLLIDYVADNQGDDAADQLQKKLEGPNQQKYTDLINTEIAKIRALPESERPRALRELAETLTSSAQQILNGDDDPSC